MLHMVVRVVFPTFNAVFASPTGFWLMGIIVLILTDAIRNAAVVRFRFCVEGDEFGLQKLGFR